MERRPLEPKDHPTTIGAIREAAEAVAKVFGCPVEEAEQVIMLGIDARMGEQAEARRAAAEPPTEPNT